MDNSDKELISTLAKLEGFEIIGFDDDNIFWCTLKGKREYEDGFEKITVDENDPAWLYRPWHSSQTRWIFDPISFDEQAYKLIKKYEIGFRMGQYANAHVWFTQCKGDAQWGWCTNDSDLNRAVVKAAIEYLQNKG